MNKSAYNIGKSKARIEAIEWQWIFDCQHYDYMRLSIESARLEKLAKRFGLVREFRENGLI